MTRGRATHSDRLERWLGAEQVAYLSKTFGGFYWPIPLHGVPGNVHIMPGGDFAGEIKAGSFLSKHDGAAMVLKKLRKAAEAKQRRFKALGTLLDMIRMGDPRLASIGAFASVDAVVAAYTGGKGQQIMFAKTGTASTAIASSTDMWYRAGQPIAGAAGTAAPGGKAWSASDAGALGYKNLGTAESGHYLNWTLAASVINNSLLLYDRLFCAASSGTQLSTNAEVAVTGVPTRYQNTTAGNDAYIGGNFMYPVSTTQLSATAHNWLVGGGAGVGCTYLDETNTASNMPVLVGQSGATATLAGSIDIVAGQGSWFAPLASGDVGVKAMTNFRVGTNLAAGVVDWVIGHPIAVNACPVANMACLDDGLYTALNLTHIEDSACLAFIELPKPATTATTYSGILRTVSE
jgi:hypothetical protein